MDNLSSVRRIPIRNRSLSGEVSIPRLKTAVSFESGLERDFVYINAIDPTVTNIISQPCRITFKDEDSKDRHYTPDYLVTFASQDHLPLLVEIKYSEELREKAEELEPKFAAAKSYAAEQKWRFAAITETEIRIPLLENAKRLLPMQAREADSGLAVRLLSKVTSRISIGSLLDKADLNGMDRARGLNTILILVSQSSLHTDLSLPINQSTVICKPKDGAGHG